MPGQLPCHGLHLLGLLKCCKCSKSWRCHHFRFFIDVKKTTGFCTKAGDSKCDSGLTAAQINSQLQHGDGSAISYVLDASQYHFENDQSNFLCVSLYGTGLWDLQKCVGDSLYYICSTSERVCGQNWETDISNCSPIGVTQAFYCVRV